MQTMLHSGTSDRLEDECGEAIRYAEYGSD